ncbi:MAG: hypothetical protein M1834_003310 [Cirrosporium novae-zelandiae]|nr:MAG: hypothetical protein M1834_003310 [Cirrosporium novae-zelandiae]
MVLDPFSALAVASSVIQFIDFGTKIIDKTLRLCLSTSGSLPEHDELQADSERIKSLMSTVDTDIRTYEPAEMALMEPASSGKTSRINSQLLSLVDHNSRMELNLTTKIQDLKSEIVDVIRRTSFHASDLKKFPEKLSKLTNKSRTITAQTAILSSLYFSNMKQRYDQIQIAETHTFVWIFENKSPGPSLPRIHFAEWLQSQKPDDNIYWISGKPGSGKSTLMKFLHDHGRTRQLLDIWANKKKFYGLDEYEGQPQDMINLIRKLPKSSDIKFCFASRKWNAFMNEFGEDIRDISRVIYLEQLTKNDIQTYVQHEFGREQKFSRLKRQNLKESGNLVDEVVTKAEGVFLWVDLVVKSLIRGLQNADSAATLQKRLADMPSDLNKYFDSMLANVEKVYRVDAAKIYQIMLRTIMEPYLLMFSFLEQTNSEFGTMMDIKPYSLEDSRLMPENMRSRLNARCTDLLLITEDTTADPYWKYKVRFLHRTVRDYMAGKNAQERLAQWISQDKGRFDLDIYICQSLLAQIKPAPDKISQLNLSLVGPLLIQISHFAREIKNTSDDPQVRLLNQLETSLTKYGFTKMILYPERFFIKWANKRKLKLYVSARLKDEPHLAKELASTAYSKADGYKCDSLRNSY